MESSAGVISRLSALRPGAAWKRAAIFQVSRFSGSVKVSTGAQLLRSSADGDGVVAVAVAATGEFEGEAVGGRFTVQPLGVDGVEDLERQPRRRSVQDSAASTDLAGQWPLLHLCPVLQGHALLHRDLRLKGVTGGWVGPCEVIPGPVRSGCIAGCARPRLCRPRHIREPRRGDAHGMSRS